jgi:hypothetical protein
MEGLSIWNMEFGQTRPSCGPACIDNTGWIVRGGARSLWGGTSLYVMVGDHVGIRESCVGWLSLLSTFLGTQKADLHARVLSGV